MATCGGLRIGVLSSEPKTPPLVMVNVPPVRSSSVSVPLPARAAKSRMACSISANDIVVGVANDRHDQTAFGADRHADVVIVLVDDLVALDFGVELRKQPQRRDARLDEERGDAEADAVLLLEDLLAPLAQRHERGHVDLVERRQHRRGALRLDQPSGDGCAALASCARAASVRSPGSRARHGAGGGCRLAGGAVGGCCRGCVGAGDGGGRAARAAARSRPARPAS